MLRTLHQITHCTLAASDGEIGSSRDVYFDHEYWVVRYLVVNTGGWLSGREVLIASRALGEVDPEKHRVPVSLTREQVKNSPDVSTDRPISRKEEAFHYQYYGWPAYWGGVGTEMDPFFLGTGLNPLLVKPPLPRDEMGGETNELDTRLRSAREVKGYHIQAQDGDIGHVDEFLVDCISWQIQYLVLETKNWWPGRKVVIPTTSFHNIDWFTRTITVNLTRAEIQGAPEYTPDQLNPHYAENLRTYFTRKESKLPTSI